MYNHKKIEHKWQEYWDKNKVFKTDTYDFSKPKYYILDMFPYPSGDGLHVGHPRGYTASDVLARYKRMQGFNVLHPMGWDAFGLPAEQFAIKTGNHPESFTQENIKVFTRQLKSLGFSFDWDREIDTTDPSFVKWTQWIFTQLYEMDLAYVAEMPVNFCPELGTVLANEEVIDGKSEVGGFEVIRKPMRQWVLKITAYAERLLEDLDLIDWPESTKEMQRNWIGKSEGAEVIFQMEDHDLSFTVFTTRPDTLFAATYCVLAPEHPFVEKIVSNQQKAEVAAYVEEVLHKSDLERTELNKEKTGVFTGAYAINPVNNKKIPVYIADYVLASYGSGAIMAVPAHDQRDYEFAQKYGLEILPVIADVDVSKEAYTGDGPHINSDFINGLTNEQASKKMIAYLEEHGLGSEKTTYKLRDWLFSRQRYWGEPIPIVHMEDGSMRAVALEELPLELPPMDDFKPAPDGQSPLAKASDWLKVEFEDGQIGYRETNTMPQWAASSWYFFRYLDPHNDEALADPKLIEHWMPVDLYIGGAEHAVLHLLYARFWHKVLYDLGITSTKEPFQMLYHQGMILGPNNEKMSKSRGNVINPDLIVESHGADTLRVYEMFMGPLDGTVAWSEESLDGSRRWLDRVWRLFTEVAEITEKNDGKLDLIYHQTVKKVTEDIESFGMNTAIAQMMIFTNEAYKEKRIYKEHALGFIKMLSVFAPHMGEELYERMGYQDSIAYTDWPVYDSEKLVLDVIELIVQVDGRLRAKIEVARDLDEETLKEKVYSLDAIKRHTEGKEVVREIFVKNKLVNLVTR